MRSAVQDTRGRTTTGIRDLAAAEEAAADLLRALGVRLDSESLRDTPRRMAQAYAELLTPARSR